MLVNEPFSNTQILKFNFSQVPTWKIIYLNCQERYEDMIDHCSFEITAWKRS